LPFDESERPIDPLSLVAGLRSEAATHDSHWILLDAIAVSI
jgi:hypothetical protein